MENNDPTIEKKTHMKPKSRNQVKQKTANEEKTAKTFSGRE
jgi:hypothetical protein